MAARDFFSSGDLGLDPHVCQLNARVADLFPEFFNGSAAARLRLQPDLPAGRGLALAEGCLPPPGTAVALYFGRVVLGDAPGDYVLSLPPFSRAGRSWHASVDAGPLCSLPDPDLCNAALCNQT